MLSSHVSTFPAQRFEDFCKPEEFFALVKFDFHFLKDSDGMRIYTLIQSVESTPSFFETSEVKLWCAHWAVQYRPRTVTVYTCSVIPLFVSDAVALVTRFRLSMRAILLLICLMPSIVSFPRQNVLFSIGSAFLYYASQFKLYSSFCASHSKAQKVLHPSKYSFGVFFIASCHF